jgi:hypothetical protein
VLTADPKWLAIEVELAHKSADRLADILSAYRNRQFSEDGPWGVLYLVPDERRAAQLREHARRADFDDDDTVIEFRAQPIGSLERLHADVMDMAHAYRAAREREARRRAEAAAARERRRDAPPFMPPIPAPEPESTMGPLPSHRKRRRLLRR